MSLKQNQSLIQQITLPVIEIRYDLDNIFLTTLLDEFTSTTSKSSWAHLLNLTYFDKTLTVFDFFDV